MCLAFQWVGETHKSEELRNVRYPGWEHRWTRQSEDKWRWPETIFERIYGLSLWISGWLVLSYLQNSREIQSPGLLVPWPSFTSWWTKLSDSPCEPVHKTPSQPTLHLPETSLSIVSNVKVDGPKFPFLVFLKQKFFYSYTTQLTLSTFWYQFFTTVSLLFLGEQASDTWELETVSFNSLTLGRHLKDLCSHGIRWSLPYQAIPVMTDGIVLVISPTIALMEDQVCSLTDQMLVVTDRKQCLSI